MNNIKNDPPMLYDLILDFDPSHGFGRLEPLNRETQNTLRDYIFKDIPFDGGCARLQAFAQKVSTLKDLQKKYSDQEIGPNDRAIAIAKCVVLALLVAAFVNVYVSTLVFMFSSPPAFIHAHIGLVLSHLVGGELGVAFSSAGLILQGCATYDIFQRPSEQEVETQLEKLAETDLSKDLENLKFLQGLLKEKIDQITKERDEKIVHMQGLGIESTCKRLETEKERLEAAFADVSKMYEALAKKPLEAATA